MDFLLNIDCWTERDEVNRNQCSSDTIVRMHIASSITDLHFDHWHI